MRSTTIALSINIYLLSLCPCYGADSTILYKMPTVAVSVLVRNKAFALPYFFSCLNNLDYPRDRMFLWIYSDYNEDQSVDIIEKWSASYSATYAGVHIVTNNTSGPLHSDERSCLHWSPQRFKHVIQLRENALEFSRKRWADYLFMLDADVFLTNPLTLKTLVSKQFEVTAPMLLSDGLYSNFWCGMTETYYYQRTDSYKPIQSRERVGCFQVPMVHTAVLIDMKSVASNLLTYDPEKIKNYNGPHDDIIAFAVNAKQNKIPLNICNDLIYGFVPVPLEDTDYLETEYDQLLNIKLEAISQGTPIPLHSELQEFVEYPEKSKYGCSEIYMINLKRRTERRHLMKLNFKELAMNVNDFDAVDGRDLDMNNLKALGVTLMPDYEDPYHKRPMKAGEIGCFLSHYNIWKEIVDKKLDITLIFEDDIHFVPYFRNKFLELMSEITYIEWDLVYLGRKILLDNEEKYITLHTTKPKYSYWTLGYLISYTGAKKLLDAKPLENMLPVDEFLPIMFDEHPNETWKSHFPTRDLRAYSAAPLLVHPTHYTGQEGYVSDTEDSPVVSDILLDNDIDNM